MNSELLSITENLALSLLEFCESYGADEQDIVALEQLKRYYEKEKLILPNNLFGIKLLDPGESLRSFVCARVYASAKVSHMYDAFVSLDEQIKKQTPFIESIFGWEVCGDIEYKHKIHGQKPRYDGVKMSVTYDAKITLKRVSCCLDNKKNSAEVVILEHPWDVKKILILPEDKV